MQRTLGIAKGGTGKGVIFMDVASVEVPLVSHIFYLLMIVFYFSMPVISNTVKCNPFPEVYERISGQAVNLQKSGILFSNNVSESLRMSISNILGEGKTHSGSMDLAI